jgi:hypothetical protein
MKSQISFSSIVGAIFFLALFGAMFFQDHIFELIAPEAIEISESKKASREVAEALLKLDRITLDTSILKSGYFQGVTVLPTFPTDSRTLANFGKTNPFLGNFQIVVAPATTTVTGGVIFSQQRSVNNNNSIVPVVNGRANAPQGRR